MAKKIKSASEWNMERYGSFGVFQSSNSLPLYYLMTTFSMDELANLSYAQDLSPDPDNIDFEMLMQRDLDRGRVRKELVPYLMEPTNSLDGAGAPDPIYFPPLIAAAVPVSSNAIERCFNEPEVNDCEGGDGISLKWPGALEFEFFKAIQGAPQSFNIRTSGVIDEWVDREPVTFKAKLANSMQKGIRLVVIDGQHRLCALREVFERNAESISQMSVPVCVVVSPLSYEKYIKEKGGNAEVHRVYRKLFVDVNTTMESVSGHFSVLLKDTSIGSIIAREFCDYVLEKKGLPGLALIEWNTKSSKDASKVIRPWSVANVKVLDMAFEKSFSKVSMTSELDSLISLPEVQSKLSPSDDEVEESAIRYDSFSPRQRNALEIVIKEKTVPLVYGLIFNLKGYKKREEVFNRHLDRIKKVSESGSEDALLMKSVHNALVSYNEVRDSDTEILRKIEEFKSLVNRDVISESSKIFEYAIFQRALIEAWSRVISIAIRNEVALDELTDGLVSSWNDSLGDKATMLSPEKDYLQDFVFQDGMYIQPQERVRKGLADLLVGTLANSKNLEALSEKVHSSYKDEFAREVAESAKSCLSNYLNTYKDIRIKRLKSGGFHNDRRVPEETIKELTRAKQKLDQQRRDLDRGIISRSEISTDLDDIVDLYMKDEMDKISRSLSMEFGCDHEIFEYASANNSEAEEVEDGGD